MIINTRDFGEIDVDEKEIITFANPVLGFEEYEKYIILMDENIGDKFAWLQSIEATDVCFMLANPSLLGDAYQPIIPKDASEAIGGSIDEMWLIAVITDPVRESKVNLKSPVVINTQKKLGAQAVSESNLPVRFELFAGKESE